MNENSESTTSINIEVKQDNLLVGFQDPLIHVFNKKASSHINTPYFKRKDFEDRRNLILIGNNLSYLCIYLSMYR
jgi:hypothetical protein